MFSLVFLSSHNFIYTTLSQLARESQSNLILFRTVRFELFISKYIYSVSGKEENEPEGDQAGTAGTYSGKESAYSCAIQQYTTALRIHLILTWIRILGSTFGTSGYGSSDPTYRNSGSRSSDPPLEILDPDRGPKWIRIREPFFFSIMIFFSSSLK